MSNLEKHHPEQTGQDKSRVSAFLIRLRGKKLLISTLLLIALLVGACGGIRLPFVGSSKRAPVCTGMTEPTVLLESTDVSADEFPVEVTYFTPKQTEGPYYPIVKPTDRDNNLIVLESAEGRPAGDVLEFGGRLFDGRGMPISGALVELWQTDSNGIYLHPRGPNNSQRDVNFQSYGEMVTGEHGWFSFRTIIPGRYERRSHHIHVKVCLEGRELLTTQLYFSNDTGLASDGIFDDAKDGGKNLIMEIEEGFDVAGNPIFIGKRDIILSWQPSD